MTDKIDTMFLNYKNYLKYRSASFSARFKYLYKFKSQLDLPIDCVTTIPIAFILYAVTAVIAIVLAVATPGIFSKLSGFFQVSLLGNIITIIIYERILISSWWISFKMSIFMSVFFKCIFKDKVSLVEHYIYNANTTYFEYNYHYDGILSTTYISKFIKQLYENKIKLTKKEKKILLPYLDGLKDRGQEFLDYPFNDEISKKFREEQLEEKKWDMRGWRD